MRCSSNRAQKVSVSPNEHNETEHILKRVKTKMTQEKKQSNSPKSIKEMNKEVTAENSN